MNTAERIAHKVVTRIHENYELNTDFVEEVRQYIIEEVLRLSNAPSNPVTQINVNHNNNSIVTPGPKKDFKKAATLEVKESKPKGKSSAYTNFIKDQMKSVLHLPHGERMKRLGTRWKSLSDDEKAAFK